MLVFDRLAKLHRNHCSCLITTTTGPRMTKLLTWTATSSDWKMHCSQFQPAAQYNALMIEAFSLVHHFMFCANLDERTSAFQPPSHCSWPPRRWIRG
jgi:hypothetical protein